MVRIAASTVILAFAFSVSAALTPDPNGAKNVGLGNGSQFITGECKSNADCASACCAAVEGQSFGICSGPGASTQNGKQGCGSFGGGGAAAPAAPPAAPAAPAAPATGGLVPDVNGAKNVGKGDGSQFITGECKSNADCASACCAAVAGQSFGICSGPGAATQNGKQGCGSFGGGAAAPAAPVTEAPAAPAAPAAGGGLTPDVNGAKNVGKGDGSQFITGECKSNADCASACCAAVAGKNFGICSGPGAATQNGKQGCGSFNNGATAPATKPASCNAKVRRALTPDVNGAKNVGLGNGSQFITGECKSNADCASACCAAVEGQSFGICSGPGAATQNGKQGCGSFNAGSAAPAAPPAGCNARRSSRKFQS